MTHPSIANPALDLGVDGIGWIVFDDPQREVNLLTRKVMEEFARCVSQARELAETGQLKAVILWSGKASTFLGGANIGDIESLTDPARGEEGCRFGQGIFQTLSDLPVPSLAAIHGVCLGGGIEMALACTRRVASDAQETRLGFPEIFLGILPAWGGTTRLPRLIGLREATRMILSGRRYSASQALALGLVDEVFPGQDFQTLALEAAHRMVAEEPHTLPKRRKKPSLLQRFTLGRRILLWLAGRQILARTGGHYPAPQRLLDVLEASARLPLSNALVLEARAAGSLIASPVSKNLIHLFHLREDARKGRGISEKVLDLPRFPESGRPSESVEEEMMRRVFASYRREAESLMREGVAERAIVAAAEAFGMERPPMDLGNHGKPRKHWKTRIKSEKELVPHLMDRLVLPMVNEATTILADSGVTRAGQIDLSLVIGGGFPAFRGGVLRYADQRGISSLACRLQDFGERLGPRFRPHPLLEELARTGETFYSRFP